MKKMFRRLTAMTMAMVMLLSFGMTALANDLTEEEVNTILADHGFSAEAIEAIDIADKATMARQILAGTHTFEENTTTDFYSVNMEGELEEISSNARISSADVKCTVFATTVEEYGEFAYILYIISYEWLTAPGMTTADAFAVSWSNDFAYRNSSFQLNGYYKELSSNSWILDYTSVDRGKTDLQGFGVNLPYAGSIPKWQIQFKLEPKDSAPASGVCEIAYNYAYNKGITGLTVNFKGASISFDGWCDILGDSHQKAY